MTQMLSKPAASAAAGDRSQAGPLSRPRRPARSTTGSASRTAGQPGDVACAAASGTAPRDVRGRATDDGRREHDVELAVEQRRAGPSPGAPAARARVRGRPCSVRGCAARHSAAGVVEHDAHGRQSVRARAEAIHAARRSGSRPSVSTTVVRPRPNRRRDDLLEQRERVRARGEVLVALADDRAELVARHDLLRREMCAAPTSTSPRPTGRPARPGTAPAGRRRWRRRRRRPRSGSSSATGSRQCRTPPARG